MNRNRFSWPVTPLAMKENTVNGEKYRFTVLSKHLIRMEYSPKGVFEDRASQRVFHRDFPVCEFDSSVDAGILTIDTGELLVKYAVDKPFAQDTLSIQLKCEPGSTWRYGDYTEVETSLAYCRFFWLYGALFSTR